jgi:hypothetical protein
VDIDGTDCFEPPELCTFRLAQIGGKDGCQEVDGLSSRFGHAARWAERTLRVRRMMALSVVVALSGASVLFAWPASATVSISCGTSRKLAASTPYNDDSVFPHPVSTRGFLTCGPFSSSRQWKVTVLLEQYYFGAWHVVANETSGWMTAKSGKASTRPASVSCTTGLTGYEWRAQATGYLRSSSTSSTTRLGSTFSSTVTRYC